MAKMRRGFARISGEFLTPDGSAGRERIRFTPLEVITRDSVIFDRSPVDARVNAQGHIFVEIPAGRYALEIGRERYTLEIGEGVHNLAELIHDA